MGASRCIECGQVFFSAKIRVGRCAPCRLKAAGGIVPAGSQPGQPGVVRPTGPMGRPATPPRPVTSVPSRAR